MLVAPIVLISQFLLGGFILILFVAKYVSYKKMNKKEEDGMKLPLKILSKYSIADIDGTSMSKHRQYMKFSNTGSNLIWLGSLFLILISVVPKIMNLG